MRTKEELRKEFDKKFVTKGKRTLKISERQFMKKADKEGFMSAAFSVLDGQTKEKVQAKQDHLRKERKKVEKYYQEAFQDPRYMMAEMIGKGDEMMAEMELAKEVALEKIDQMIETGDLVLKMLKLKELKENNNENN